MTVAMLTKAISPGQLISKPAKIQNTTLESVISWKDQKLVFENEPFPQLIRRLERWYNISIDVRDTVILNKNRYTGKFVHNESLEQVLKVVSRTTPIQYTINLDKVQIKAKD